MRKEMVDKITQELVDKGKLIEAGFVGLRLLAIPKDASEVQVIEMRKAFFAGAQHLFVSILNVLDADAEPTEQDLKRMSLIASELDAFTKELNDSFN